MSEFGHKKLQFCPLLFNDKVENVNISRLNSLISVEIVEKNVLIWQHKVGHQGLYVFSIVGLYKNCKENASKSLARNVMRISDFFKMLHDF